MLCAGRLYLGFWDGILPQLVLMLVVAWSHFFVLVRSDLASGLGSGYTTEIGTLTSETAEASALAKLISNESWWQLAKVPWHDSAIERFFAAGPLAVEEMEALAAQNHNPDSWNASRIAIKQHTDLTQALQRISTVTYRMSKFVEGTGKIEASMWTLLFRCIGTSCSDGYLVPMVIVPDAGDDSAYVYATLWLPVTGSLLVNAIPSFIFGLLPEPSPISAPLTDAIDSDLSLELNVHRGQSCPRIAVANCRTLLDGTYGLVPHTACIRVMSSNTSFNLLVSVPASASASNGTDKYYFTSVESLLLWMMGSNNSSWVLQPFEACSDEAVLVPRIEDVSHYFMMCYKASCKGFRPQNMSCSSDQVGVLSLRSMLAYIKASPECTSVPLHSELSSASLVSCRFSPTEVCMFTAYIQKDDTASGGRMQTVSPVSRWISTKGVDTKEFQQSSINASGPEFKPCTVQNPSLSLHFSSNSVTQLPFPKAVQIRARAYLASYIAEHNVAFSTSKGPRNDQMTVIAAIVSTAFSLHLGALGYLTKFLLKKICKRSPQDIIIRCRDQKAPHISTAKVLCFLIVCSINVGLCIVSFLLVMAMALGELDRKSPFHTWDLGSNDLNVYDFNLQQPEKLRVVYLLSAISTYESQIFNGIVAFFCIACLFVGGSTLWHCRQIFERQRKLVLKHYAGRPN